MGVGTRTQLHTRVHVHAARLSERIKAAGTYRSRFASQNVRRLSSFYKNRFYSSGSPVAPPKKKQQLALSHMAGGGGMTPAQLLDQQKKANATMIEMEERRIEKMHRRQVGSVIGGCELGSNREAFSATF